MVSLARIAFTQAVNNDARGIVSENDAKRLVGAGLRDINQSSDPQAAFDNASRYMSASHALLGTDQDARSALSGFASRGQSAVLTRLEALTGKTQLPKAIERAFAELVRWGDIVTPDADAALSQIELKNVKGDAQKGFSFDYAIGDVVGTIHATNYEHEWILAPIELSKNDLDQATSAMREYFDAYWADELISDYDETPESVADMRDSIIPESFIWPGNTDPIGISDGFPVALAFHNPTGSDHGFYAGFNPATGDSDAGDFN